MMHRKASYCLSVLAFPSVKMSKLGKKEMLVTFFSYLIYVVVLLSLVYYYAAQDMQEMHYLFGLPRYLSVLAIVAVVGGVCMAFIAHFVFKAENLEDHDGENES